MKLRKLKFKLGDIVKCISNQLDDIYCVNKIGKIISIDKLSVLPYVVEFFEPVKGHSGAGRGKEEYCWRFSVNKIKLHVSILKLFLKEKKDGSL